MVHNLVRSVRRVTIIDGVDIPVTYLHFSQDFHRLVSTRLLVVSVGANSVTYDLEFLYSDDGVPTTLEYEVKSNVVSVGVDTDFDVIVDTITPDRTYMSDTHIRDCTNGKVVVNILSFYAEEV